MKKQNEKTLIQPYFENERDEWTTCVGSEWFAESLEAWIETDGCFPEMDDGEIVKLCGYALDDDGDYYQDATEEGIFIKRNGRLERI